MKPTILLMSSLFCLEVVIASPRPLQNGQGRHAEHWVQGVSANEWWLEGQRDQPSAQRRLTGNLVVRLNEGTHPEVIAAEHGLSVQAPAWTAPWVIFQGPLETVLACRERLLADARVAEVVLESRRSRKLMADLPSDTLMTRLWHLYNQGGSQDILLGIDINVRPIWGGFEAGGVTGFRGRGVRIAIVDDGVQFDHPELNIDQSLSLNLSPGHQLPWPFYATDNHGTAVAGIVAAKANNAPNDATVGLVGVAPEATLTSIRLLGGSELSGPNRHQPTDAEEALSFVWKGRAGTQNVPIQNHSWGIESDVGTVGGPGELGEAALAWGTRWGRGGKGTIYVFASGNSDFIDDQPLKDINYNGYASSRFTIAVGGIRDNGLPPTYAQRGAALHVVAPCDNSQQSTLIDQILATDRTGTDGYNTSATGAAKGNLTRFFSGTSAAAPQVSGVCALMLEANPRLGWRDVQEILLRSAKQVKPENSDWRTNGAGLHFHHDYGAGVVDATAAVTLAQAWKNLGPQHTLSQKRNDLNAAIPDGDTAGVDFNFQFTDANFRVEQVEVTLLGSHQRRAQLRLKLTSPSGMESLLLTPNVVDTSPSVGGHTFTSVRHWGESALGNWTVSLADTVAGFTGTLTDVSIDLHGTSTVPDAYDQWLEQHFGAEFIADSEREATLWGQEADPDGDSWPNLCEAAFGTNPQQPDSPDLRVSVDGNEFVLNWPVSLVGEILHVLPEWSPDLKRYFLGGDIVDGQSRTLRLLPRTNGRQEARLTRGSLSTASMKLGFVR